MNALDKIVKSNRMPVLLLGQAFQEDICKIIQIGMNFTKII